MTILTARQPGEQAAAKLRLKKLPDGTLELSLRDADAAAAANAAAAAAAQPGGLPPGALAPKVWAWPLPLVGMQEWVPYETLLRSILAAQPLQQLQRELQKGVALRLTKSSVTGVNLIHFDMELAGRVAQEAAAVMPADMLLDMDSKCSVVQHTVVAPLQSSEATEAINAVSRSLQRNPTAHDDHGSVVVSRRTDSCLWTEVAREYRAHACGSLWQKLLLNVYVYAVNICACPYSAIPATDHALCIPPAVVYAQLQELKVARRHWSCGRLWWRFARSTMAVVMSILFL